MKSLTLIISLAFLFFGCSKNSTTSDILSNTQIKREVCLDWYGYKIQTEKAIDELKLKVKTESELMAYCEFFKNVADTK